jgi:hypothetical protein
MKACEQAAARLCPNRKYFSEKMQNPLKLSKHSPIHQLTASVPQAVNR